MSRTYRHIRDLEYRDWVRCDNGHLVRVRNVELKGKKLAKARADGRYWEPTGWYFKQCHIKRRRNDKKELSKVYRTTDFEGYDFDDTPATAKWKGVWWDIY